MFQNWLTHLRQSLKQHSLRFVSRSCRHQRLTGKASSEVLEVRSLLAANIIATLAEADGENGGDEATLHDSAQPITTGDPANVVSMLPDPSGAEPDGPLHRFHVNNLFLIGNHGFSQQPKDDPTFVATVDEVPRAEGDGIATVGVTDAVLREQPTVDDVSSDGSESTVPNEIEEGDGIATIGVTDAALLEQQTSDNVIGEGLEIAAANEIDVEHNETTEPQETSEKVNEIDLAFTNFVAPF